MTGVGSGEGIIIDRNGSVEWIQEVRDDELMRHFVARLEQPGFVPGLEEMKVVTERCVGRYLGDGEHVIAAGESQVFPRGLYDGGEEDGLRQVAAKMAKRLSGTDEGVVYANWVFDRLGQIYEEGGDYGFVYLALEAVDSHVPGAIEIGEKARRVLESITWNVSEEVSADEVVVVMGDREVCLDEYDVWDLEFVLSSTKGHEVVLRSLARDGDRNEQRKWLARQITRVGGNVPLSLNVLRGMIEDPRLEAEHAGLESMMQWLMGGLTGENIRAHTDLMKLYESFPIETHSLVMHGEERAAMLEPIFDELGILKVVDRMVEFGAGTGGLVMALARRGYRVTGIDYSRRNIAHGLWEMRRHGMGGLLSWQSWYKTSFANLEMKAVLSLGRSLSHAETVQQLGQIFDEAGRILEPGGFLIYDGEDPDCGSRGVAHHRYDRFLHDELGVAGRTPYIVDSPDGKNFYNRLVLRPQEHLEELIRHGFMPLGMIREDMPGGGGNVNVVCIARKMTQKEREESFGKSREIAVQFMAAEAETRLG